MTGGGPHDRIAAVGTCEFTLKNGPTADDPDRAFGHYSPNHADVRSGFNYGIPVRVVYVLGGVEYPLWTGKLRSALPEAGQYRSRLVHCVAVDAMADLAETDVRSIAPQINKTENQLIAAVIAAMPAASRPHVNYDASLDTYPYALDDASSNVKALSLIAAVVQSARAFVYPQGNGDLRVENRHARAMLPAVGLVDDSILTVECQVPSDLSDVYNRVRVITHPRRIDAAATTVLYAVDNVIAVAPGETVDVWGDYVDPTNSQKLIGGTDQVTPIVENTDYDANTQENGGGADVSADLSIVTNQFAASVNFEVTNNGASTAYLVNSSGAPKLQIRGKGIYDESPQSFEATSAQSYGERLLEIDLPYQDDVQTAADLAQFELLNYQQVADRIDRVTFGVFGNAELLAGVVATDIGTIALFTETMTGLSLVHGAIQGIEMSATPRNQLTVSYVLAPRVATSALVLDDPVYGVLDAGEAALGYA